MKTEEIVRLARQFAETLRKPCPDGHIPEVWEKASDEMVKEMETMFIPYTAWLLDRYLIVPKEKVKGMYISLAKQAVAGCDDPRDAIEVNCAKSNLFTIKEVFGEQFSMEVER